MPNSYKEDIRLMLGKLTNMIENDSVNESLLSSIYNDFDNLNTIDQFVIREYVSDCINEIMESRKLENNQIKVVKSSSTLSANCRVVPGNDGKFYVFDEDKIIGSYDNENDARNFCQAQQKNTLVSADEEFTEESDEVTPDETVSASLEDESDVLNDETLEEVELETETDVESDALKEILEDAENILSIIDSNIKMTTDLDTVAKMIVQEDAINIKKEALEELDPSDPTLNDTINKFRDFLDQVELESIDLINKNAPGADIESEDVATEMDEKLDDIEEQIELEEKEENILQEDTAFTDESKTITDETVESEDDDKVSVDSLAKEESSDAPSAEDISETLGDFNDEVDFEFVDDEESFEPVVDTINEIDNLIEDLMSVIHDNVEDEEIVEELDEIKTEIQENLDKVESNIEEPEVFDDELEIFDDEIPAELLDDENVESIDDAEVLEDESSEEIIEELVEDDKKDVVAESEVIEEISEKELHEVDFPGGTGAAKEAVVAGKTKKSKKVKKDDTKTKDTKNKKSK